MVHFNWKRVLFGLSTIFILSACDKITNEDVAPPTLPKTLPTMYVQAGNSAVMNVTTVVSSAAQITITQGAKNGTLSFESGIFMRYVPFATVNEGRDSFKMTINNFCLLSCHYLTECIRNIYAEFSRITIVKH